MVISKQESFSTTLSRSYIVFTLGNHSTFLATFRKMFKKWLAIKYISTSFLTTFLHEHTKELPMPVPSLYDQNGPSLLVRVRHGKYILFPLKITLFLVFLN